LLRDGITWKITELSIESMEFEVKKVSDKRFSLHNDQERVGSLDFHTDEKNYYLDYVFVVPKYRGPQMGEQVVKAGVDMARDMGLTPVANCSYAKHVMERRFSTQ